jgi:predicted dehydrogenase
MPESNRNVAGSTGSPVNRRQFLKRAAAASAAVGFPYIVPSSAYGAAGHVAPSNRLTLGFIGMGKMMGGHLGNFLGRTGVQVLAVCDVESVRLMKSQHRVDDHYTKHLGKGSYRGCAAYKNFLALVAHKDIDAVVIATPDHWHTLTSIAALKSGKDVYCEKPLTLTINEGKALVEAVRNHGRVFQTGSQQRSEWQFRTACELVRNGRIGKVHTVHVNVGGPPVVCYLPAQPVPEGLDWDFWLGPAPYRPYNADIAPGIDFGGWPNFRSYRDYSGGGMTDWGAHHFDIAQWGLGMDESGPVEIYPPDGKTYDKLTYKYANGAVMTHGGAKGRAGVEFIGDSGHVLVNRGYIETEPAAVLDVPVGPNEIKLYNSHDHQGNWLECVRTRRKPICDVAIGHRSVTVCHLGNIAYWLKRPLKWDPVKEEFVNDAEASRLLQRPMRSPWRLT